MTQKCIRLWWSHADSRDSCLRQRPMATVGCTTLEFPTAGHEGRLSRVGHFSPFGEVVNYILL